MGGKKLTVLPMIQDASYLSRQTTGIDGALSWYGWPTDGGNRVIKGPMTTVWDEKYLKSKGKLTYMARKIYLSNLFWLVLISNLLAVSPWFYTHFGSKNWAFICEEQASRRWEQMLQMKPDLVEIISWNGSLLSLLSYFKVIY